MVEFYPLYRLLLAILAAYLLGSIPSGVIISRAFAKRDVREFGSGHTGALNTVRAAGFGAGVFAFLSDTGKAIVAIQAARLITGNEWAVAMAGIAAVVGHCWPLYTHFHGGMGLATAGAALFVLDTPLVFALIALWFPLRYLLKRNARASIAVALLLPALLLVTRADTSMLAFGAGAGAVLTYRHLSASSKFFIPSA